MRRRHLTGPIVVFALSLVASGTAAGHELDHPVPGAAPSVTLSTSVNQGGEQADWELITTFLTGNPQSDLDFFTIGGDTYLAAGTLGTGLNAGGQTIVRLTEEGSFAPSFVAGHASAACTSNPASMLGLQHDVEATPKGDVIYNAGWGDLVDRTADAQLLLDASDAAGRCHDDGGALGLAGAPRGGLELIDITDPTNPVEIHLTSHIGEAHTVNVDPVRPHIAYAVSSDSVGVNADRVRANEVPGSTSYGLDGFEIVDLTTCLEEPFGTLAPGTSIDDKRDACRPEVYRYRYEDVLMALGHTNQSSIYGCHELEVHPGDLLTCGGGAAMLKFDISGMFLPDPAAPDDRTKDRINGTPLDCNVRASTSGPLTATGAMVTDCVVGEDGKDLRVASWLQDGAPSAAGIEWLGSAYHMGREALVNSAVSPAYGAAEDVDFNHEAELTHSGRNVIVTDERGGGVAPGGASCSPGVDLDQGNGGLHAYAVDRLQTEHPSSAEAAWEAYARTPEGEKAIIRAPINTQPQATECTAHVFHQVPGQNRIFMGWYSQGVQVFDYVEGVDEDGNDTFEWFHVGYFIPEYANTWTAAVWDFEGNEDGTFTYHGASSDFNVGNGRSAIDLWQVTLPPPRQLAGELEGPDDDPVDPDPGRPDDRPECEKDRPGERPPHCDDEGEAGNPACDEERRGKRPPHCDEGGEGGEGEAGAVTAAGGPAASQPQLIDARELGILARTPQPAPAGVGSASLLALALGLSLLALSGLRRRRLSARAANRS